MIDKAIENEPTKTVQQVLAELQPYFHFRLSYVENANHFSDDVKEQLKSYTLAYDDEDDRIYGKLSKGGYLKLGPLVSTDINDRSEERRVGIECRSRWSL